MRFRENTIDRGAFIIEFGGSHPYETAYHLLLDAIQWCEERFGLCSAANTIWDTEDATIWFYDQNAALEFKLRWG